MKSGILSYIVIVLIVMLKGSNLWAQDPLVDASDADVLRVLMQNAGYIVTQDIDSDGDPRLKGKISRTDYIVNFYGCTNGQSCKYIVFVAGWNLEEGYDLGKINNWNREKIWGKAHLDEELDPFLELVVNLNHGVNPQNFNDTLDWWRIAVEEFEDHIGL